jgi:hypothetical protein
LSPVLAAGWTQVKDLQPGQLLRGDRGDLTVVALVRRPGSQRVFNMAVEADHVYYVGGLSALVHNDCDEEEHHLQVKQIFGDNDEWLQEIPKDLHQELHLEIADGLDDEFAGEDAPNGYNGGQAKWQQYFNENDGAEERAKNVVALITQGFFGVE